MNWDKELEECKKLAIEAGREIKQIYESEKDWEVQIKAGDMPLTKADRVSNSIIINGLKDKFPNYAILSEEMKDNKNRLENPFCFIIDPLDGTKEFLKRNGQFTVNIGLAYNHHVVMGVIFVPVTGELYYAGKGSGAFYEDKNHEKTAIKVSNNMKNLCIVKSNSHDCTQMEQFIKKHQLRNYIKMGSSLKGCMIAKGTADIYYRFNHTMEWDTAAMHCIVEEAGGIFRQMDDSLLLYNRADCLNEKGFYAINRIENRYSTPKC